MNNQELLKRTSELAIEYLIGIEKRPVGIPIDYSELLAKMGSPLTREGEDSLQVIEHLSKVADLGLVTTAGPRYFGFVVGGVYPAGLAAEWLASAWDQCAFSFVTSPAAAVVEEVIRTWLIDLFNLPVEMSLGFTTGGTMANFTGLAAARHALLKSVSWDVEKQGLFNAPEITVVTSEESHVSIFAALQMLGLGRERVVKIPTDEQGRILINELQETLAQTKTPVLVCAQAGNVDTGAFDPISEIAPLVHERSGWLHVDGAFGMWAAAYSRYKHLTEGVNLADSITVDCHKWLNVPYDSGLIFVRNREAHQKAMALHAAYYAPSPNTARDNHNWVPEASRRARGFAIYAVMRALGQSGLAKMIERCCSLAQRMTEKLACDQRIEILNEVCLNQVLVRFLPSNGEDIDSFTAEVIKQIQIDGTCWVGGTTWHGMHAMRISVSNWSTTDADIDMSVKAILKCLNKLSKTSLATREHQAAVVDSE